MNITLARTRAVYGLSEVQGALDRSKGRSPELEAFYERMLDNGADRFVTNPLFHRRSLPWRTNARTSTR